MCYEEIMRFIPGVGVAEIGSYERAPLLIRNGALNFVFRLIRNLSFELQSMLVGVSMRGRVQVLQRLQ
jgi:hypothetical protein